jgi:hypothetical protein
VIVSTGGKGGTRTLDPGIMTGSDQSNVNDLARRYRLQTGLSGAHDQRTPDESLWWRVIEGYPPLTDFGMCAHCCRNAHACATGEDL